MSGKNRCYKPPSHCTPCRSRHTCLRCSSLSSHPFRTGWHHHNTVGPARRMRCTTSRRPSSRRLECSRCCTMRPARRTCRCPSRNKWRPRKRHCGSTRCSRLRTRRTSSACRLASPLRPTRSRTCRQCKCWSSRNTQYRHTRSPRSTADRRRRTSCRIRFGKPVRLGTYYLD
jgi:hypothetical protein